MGLVGLLIAIVIGLADVNDAEDLADPSQPLVAVPSAVRAKARRSFGVQQVPARAVDSLQVASNAVQRPRPFEEELPPATSRELPTRRFRLRGRLRTRDPQLEIGGRLVLLQGQKPAVTSADGSFEFDGLVEGPRTLRVDSGLALDLRELRKRFLDLDVPKEQAKFKQSGEPGVSKSRVSWGLPTISISVSELKPDQFIEIDVRLLPRLKGRVLYAGEDNLPVAGARIRISNWESWIFQYAAGISEVNDPKTDVDGAFDLGVLGNGHWFVDVLAEGFSTTRVEIVVGGDQPLVPLEIRLAKIDVLVEVDHDCRSDLGNLAITMVAAVNGGSMGDAEFLLGSASGLSRTQNLVEGRCVFHGLAPGDYWISFGKEHSPYFVVGGYQRRVTIKPDSTTQRVRFRLKPAFQHVARLQFGGKDIIPGAKVVLAYRDGSGRTLSTTTSRWGIVKVTLDRRVDLRLLSVEGSLAQENGTRWHGHFEDPASVSLSVFGTDEIKARGPNRGIGRTEFIIPLRLRPQ